MFCNYTFVYIRTLYIRIVVQLITSSVVHLTSLTTDSMYRASLTSYGGTLAFTTNSLLYTKMATAYIKSI